SNLTAGAEGNRLTLTAAGTVTSLQIVVEGSNNPATTQLGLTAQTLTKSGTDPIKITAGREAPVLTGRLSSDAVFNIVVGGQTYPVRILKADTDGNVTILDLVSDVNLAFAGQVVGTTVSGPVLSSGATFTLTLDSSNNALDVSVANPISITLASAIT